MPCWKQVHFKQTKKSVALLKSHWLSSQFVNSRFPSISDKTSFPMKSLSGKQSQILFIALWMRNFGPASLYRVLAHVFEQIYLILQLLLLWVPSESLGFVGVSGDCLPAGEFQEPVNHHKPKRIKYKKIILSMRYLSYEYKKLPGRGIWITLGEIRMRSTSNASFELWTQVLTFLGLTNIPTIWFPWLFIPIRVLETLHKKAM